MRGMASGKLERQTSLLSSEDQQSSGWDICAQPWKKDNNHGGRCWWQNSLVVFGVDGRRVWVQPGKAMKED